jgi:hypothetical protein
LTWGLTDEVGTGAGKDTKVNKRIVMRMSDFQWPEVVRKETFPLVKKLKLQFREFGNFVITLIY